MEQLNLGINNQTALAAIIFFIIANFALFVYLFTKSAKLEKRYAQMMIDNNGKSFESMLLNRFDDIKLAHQNIEKLNLDYSKLREQMLKCIQKVGIVRFNAFEDTGSDLSFAIALLDEKNNGVVISSIFGRSDARCYAKPVTDGASTYKLSEEEIQAIQISKKI